MKQILKYYVSGHTASGFVRYVESNIRSLDKLIVLQHPSKHVISDVLKKLQQQASMRGRQETFCSSFQKNDIEGVIFKEMSVGVIASHLLKDEEMLQIKIDLLPWFPIAENNKGKETVKILQADAYSHFAKGLSIHDDLENIYIKEMNFTKADQIADNVIAQIFQDLPQPTKVPKVYERLFGTNTMDGTVNVVKQLISPLRHRIFIKGRAGTGKSVLMKKVIEQSKLYGYDTEVYRCSFDPNSIDMVIIRALDYCLFDSTAPHEFFPDRDTDQVIDLYDDTVTAGTDEKYANEIQKVTKAYKAEMKKGLHCLKEIKAYEPFVELEQENYNELLVTVSNKIMKKI